MKKRDEMSDPDSCLNKARSDEMLFVSLGRDKAAPTDVREWCDAQIDLGLNTPDDDQITEARKWADAVEQEQNGTSARSI